jgi:hypothetical protein
LRGRSAHLRRSSCSRKPREHAVPSERPDPEKSKLKTATPRGRRKSTTELPSERDEPEPWQ